MRILCIRYRNLKTQTFKCQSSVIDVSADPIQYCLSQHSIAGKSFNMGIVTIIMYSNHYNYNLLLLIRDFLFFIQKINKYRAGERKNIGLWGMYTHQQFHCGLFGGDVVQRSGTWLVVNYVRVVVERSLLYCTPATYASCSKPSHFHS